MLWNKRARRRTRSDTAVGEEGGLFRSDRQLVQTAIFVVFFVALLLIFSLGTPEIAESEGKPARRDYVARVPFECGDYVTTRYLREKAKVPLVYEFTPNLETKKQLLNEISGNATDKSKASGADGQTAELLQVLQMHEADIEALLNDMERRGAIAAMEYEAERERGNESVNVADPLGHEVREQPLERVVVLSADHPSLLGAVDGHCQFLSPPQQQALARMLARRLTPNLRRNRKLTQAVNRKRMKAVPPVRKEVPRGETILHQGTRVERQQLEELRREREAFAQSAEGHKVRIQSLAGTGLTLLVLVGLAGAYILIFEPHILRNDTRYVALLGWIVVLAVTTRLFYLHALPESLAIIPLWTMVLAVAFNRRFAAEMAIFGSLFIVLAGYKFTPMMFVLAAGGVVTALLAGNARYRSDLIKAGMGAAVVQIACVWGAGLLESETGIGWEFWKSELFDSSLVLGIGAVASGFVVSGSLPLIEKGFDVTTNVGLLEWSDPNKPVLQRMLKEAPGTYHHSMIVGSLAADAAEAVGANPLLARVSAYYHDIGKLIKPDYFIENLRPDENNKHDSLSPTMSSLIITAHTRDGVDLAMRYGLPQVVRGVILQHHGTTRVEYFYRRAQQMSADGEEVSAEAFRYRGPRPQSLEAAIVMLCDSVEGATRAMRDMPPQKVGAKVREIMMSRLMDGQFDESGLSMTDLYRVEQALIRSLNAIFHNRIPYPEESESQEHEPAAQAQS